MGNIISNIKAQGQKIYKSTKGLIVEDGLVKNSLGEAVDKVSGKYQKEYVNYLKLLKDEADNGKLDMLTKVKGQALKKTPSEMSVLGSKLDKDNISKVGKAVSNRVAVSGHGYGVTDMDKAYGNFMKKTKGAIGMNMPGSMASNYYINPLKDGISAMKTTSFKNNTNLHKGLVRVGGTSAGVGVGGALAIGSSMNDEDLKQTNAKLRTMYDEGRL